MSTKTHIIKRWETDTTAKTYCGRWLIELQRGDFQPKVPVSDGLWCKHCRKAKDFIDGMRAMSG